MREEVKQARTVNEEDYDEIFGANGDDSNEIFGANGDDIDYDQVEDEDEEGKDELW